MFGFQITLFAIKCLHLNIVTFDSVFTCIYKMTVRNINKKQNEEGWGLISL